jgi:hypothetical protein
MSHWTAFDEHSVWCATGDIDSPECTFTRITAWTGIRELAQIGLENQRALDPKSTYVIMTRLTPQT